MIKKTTTLANLLTLATLAFNAEAASLKLESIRTAQPVAIDGVQESVWQQATPLKVAVNETPYKPNNGYEGMQETTVELRSVYDQQHVYFLVRYPDPTHSLERFPWVKQSDGSWKQLKAKDNTGHDNTYYEDKVAMIWDINEKGFAKKGCDKSCHITEDGMLDGVKDTSAGRHFTKYGETLDMWHWKSARTNPVGQMDDQFINSDRNESKSWGRHGDIKTGGGYKNNHNADKTAPAYMNSQPNEGNRYWVEGDNKTEFVDNFQPGDVIGGIVTGQFQGPRADLSARGEWKDGYWTLEIKRALVTKGEKSDKHDVQFTDLAETYRFGVTVFDNSQINHLFHKKPIKLTFK